MLANRMIQAAAAASQANAKVYVDDVFSAYTYTGNGSTQTINNSIQLGEILGTTDQIAYTAAGTYAWVCPPGVTSVSVVCVGGPGWKAGAGLGYKNNISVTPGSLYTVVVGANPGGATAGTDSYFISAATVKGGGGGSTSSGGVFTGDGGGNGGGGGGGIANDGGGGAGGYAGNGGTVGVSNFAIPANGGAGGAGSGGGGGGGGGSGNDLEDTGGASLAKGGGVGLLGQGSSGSGGAGGTSSIPAGYADGSPGSGGTGATYGGGNQGAASGAVRIIWPGNTRSFPSTDTGDLTPVGRVAGKGGLVWIKDRTNGSGNHYLSDTLRPGGSSNALSLVTNSTAAASAGGFVDYTSYTSAGFTANFVSGGGGITTSSSSYISWTFRKAAKFFDVVTYTGNSANGRSIAHNLGVTPGMIIIKCTSAGTTSWIVWHRSLATPTVDWLVLNSSAAADSTNAFWSNTSPTSTHFTVSSNSNVNASPETYVAYIFAHDTAADGIIQCGSFTGTGAAGLSVALGWEPQYLLIKKTNGTISGSASSWTIWDASRGMTSGGVDAVLWANLSDAESTPTVLSPTATGFQIETSGAFYNESGSTYIYLAIRRPNKPPTLGTQVYKAIARTGTGSAATVTGVGFAPDLVAAQARSVAYGGGLYSRLCGSTKAVSPYNVNAERTDADSLTSFDMDGFSVGVDAAGWYLNKSPATYINHLFKRAPGMFDVVCYTGTGVAKTEAHGLGVVPELMIVKTRSGSGEAWIVSYANSPDAGTILALNSTNGNMSGNPTIFNSTRPTSSVLSLGTATSVNANTATYIAYLFATKSGISKVGSYTGDGSTGKIINCDFTTTARFVLIKRTDAAGDWYIWDTTRGITNGSNDPHLSLNATAAEVTTDNSVDPHSQGFMVNQVAATNINVNTATYIYLAIS